MSPLVSSLHQATECSRHPASQGNIIRLVLTMVTVMSVMTMVTVVTSWQGVKLSLGPVVDTLEEG